MVRSVAYLLYLSGIIALLVVVAITLRDFKQFNWLWMLGNAGKVGALFLAGLLFDLVADIGNCVGRLFNEETA